MSRPQKIHKPLGRSFQEVLGAVVLGDGKGRDAAIKLNREKGMGKTMANKRKPDPPKK